MNDQPGMRIDITIDDGFEPGPRTTTAITELIDALHDEHPTDDVTGYTTPTLRNLTFNFASTAGTSPSSLTAPNPPSTRFASTASGSPASFTAPNPPSTRFGSSAGGSPNV